jgi:hypothetical protein
MSAFIKAISETFKELSMLSLQYSTEQLIFFQYANDLAGVPCVLHIWYCMYFFI